MNALDLLLSTSLGTALLALVFARFITGRMLLTMMYGIQLVILFQIAPASVVVSELSFKVWEHSLGWQFDGISWFFAIITLGTAFFVSWYSSGEYGSKFQSEGGASRLLHAGLALNVFAMLLLLSSADLLSLFLGWELVSWSGVLLMVLGGAASREAAVRYVTYAIAGGMAVLFGIILIYTWSGSLSFDEITSITSTLGNFQLWILAALLIGGFSIKMGLMPFHLWQAPAYALTAGPAASFLGAISSRMGLFAIILVLTKIVSLQQLEQLYIITEMFSARDLLAWIAAITIVLPTYNAMRQNDARLLLAWHGIGQGGYMMLGILMLDEMGSAGGLMHVFNYATYQAALFMSVFAIIHRTGTSDLNKLGGLVTRMPLTFVVMLFSIIGLAGLPPMNGFVSKWMVYRSLLNEGMPLLFLAAVIGTLGTILSVYKLIHNSFLGQLRVEHHQVAEAPWSMMLPMLLLSVIMLATGVMPGLVLEYVTIAQQAMGVAMVNFHLGGIEAGVSQIGGDLDMIWIVIVLFSGFAIAALLFLSTGKSRRINQLDNYAGGHFLTAENQYHYSDNFYAGLMHLIRPWYRNSFKWLEESVVSVANSLGGLFKSFFHQVWAANWLLASSTIIMIWLVL
jgi:formate hydrogenlyase subunit 3/multisubunit Na+/H+ antiporter MnhD subunit